MDSHRGDSKRVSERVSQWLKARGNPEYGRGLTVCGVERGERRLNHHSGSSKPYYTALGDTLPLKGPLGLGAPTSGADCSQRTRAGGETCRDSGRTGASEARGAREKSLVGWIVEEMGKKR